MPKVRRSIALLLRGPLLAAIAVVPIATLVSPAAAEPPVGWILTGSHPQAYDTGVDKTLLHAGKPSAYLKSKGPEVVGFGTLMQMVGADNYRGKRVRLSAFIKHQNVLGKAGLWMRVDGPQAAPLAFDNMDDRPIKGAGGWKRYEVVLDVPPMAINIAFGTLLSGKGEVFINGTNLAPVDKSVPVTGGPTGGEAETKKLSALPRNLDFAE